MYLRSSRLAASISVFVAAALLAACGRPGEQQGGPPPTPVSVAEVAVRDVVPWDEFTGRIESIETVRVSPRVGGVVEEVRYREGALVKKGDPLFSLDARPFRAELAGAEAELARAGAQAELAHNEQQRAKNLFERKLLSQDAYDQRVAAEHQADAELRAAEAAVQIARLNLGYTDIRSPIEGRAGRALATRGNLVASDPTPDVLTTIVSLDPIYVTFDADEMTYLRYAGNPARDATVYVGLADENGFPHEGRVDFVDNQVNPQSGTIRMRAVLPNKDHRLTPGLFARVKLLGREPASTLLVDDGAVLTDQDRKFVYVLGQENSAQRRDIAIGRLFEGLRVVTSGLQPGDKIIVHGVQKIFFPGMPVVPQPITMGDPPPAPPAGAAAGDGH